ncbi:arylsulfotransferase family protein [Candidatus Gracilibacteria bacterium]|nr:arylsulfotransferase family protein [Candidatus Gracilibacteria bacterium]
MRKGFSLVLFILAINLASAYIDPGTGGYLVTSFGSYLITFLAIFFAATAAFLSKTFIIPLKSFFKKYETLLRRLAVVLVILFFLWFVYSQVSFQEEVLFDESLSGVHIYSESEVYPGYILFQGKLMDIQGNVVHEWNSTHLGIIQEDGTYLAQVSYEKPLFGKYTFDDEIIWEKTSPVIHHEISITPGNTILTLTKETHEYHGRLVEFDVILEYTQAGELIGNWSTWEHLGYLKQFHQPLELEKPSNFFIPEEHKKNTSIWGANYDYYHANSIRTLPKNKNSDFEMLLGDKMVRPFQEGNWLFSFRHGSMVFILDKDTKEVVWRITQFDIEGDIQGPHDPTMLPNGNIMIFDNGRYREWSRLIEIDPFTLEVVWEYKDPDFFTLTRGDAQVLPNGNVLIVESDSGRIFEINKDKEIVWEYYRPEKYTEEMGGSAEEEIGKRMAIHHAKLYEKDFIEQFL